MLPDTINALFEFVGAFAVIFNIKCIFKDKEIKGVSIIPFIFFSLWGLWNIFYYPHLEQFASFIAAIFLTISNCIYAWLMLYYRFKSKG